MTDDNSNSPNEDGRLKSKSSPKTGRKVDSSIENPIDNMMIEISDKMSPTFKSMGYTPNGITTISLIFALGALYSLYNHDVYQFAIYLALAHLFDCMDGYYARKYDMVTDTGDKYDHFKDLLVAVGIIYVLFSKYNIMSFPVLMLSMMLLAVLSIISVGCHEKITHHSDKSETLAIFDIITPCRETCDKYTKYLRFFGPGTVIFVVIMCVFYLNSKLNCDDETDELSGSELVNVQSNLQVRDILDISRPFNGFGTTSTNPFI
ncbi:CDP-alcohol phosphatidyltransferase [Yasminevirus sp. GU-2018]|uniref:CDP-alcohol phosphatidyltransferase n=1 Tax=Yasminevirus sp. GU-2018 TaxID=2420051 RepID=A0A5K0U9U6_9VIRU|nr:CDP-alcohol phosphatidyltransferase [Yasminevirus sp. GU-2018]